MKLDVPAPEKEFINNYFENRPVHYVKLRGEVSSRQYYRFSSEAKSLILVKYPEEKTLDLYKASEKLLLEHQIPCPQTIFHQRGSLILLIEDLGDWHLYHALLSKGFDWNQLVDKAIEIGNKFLKIKDHPHFQRELIRDRWADEWNDIEEFFLKKYLKQACDSVLLETFHDLKLEIQEKSEALPKVYLHRDFHSKNIIIFNKDIFIIDHQDLMKGPIGYDQVSLAFDSYTSLNPQKFSDHYPVTWEDVRPLAIQRCLKAASTFSKVYVQTGKTDYLHYIFNCLSKLISVDCSWKSYVSFKNELVKLV